VRRLCLWLRAVFDASGVEREIEDEIQFHLDARTREYRLRGYSEDEAHDLARRRFGDVAGVEGQCRRLRMVERTRGGAPMMNGLIRDLRHAVRSLLRTPGPTAVILATLALGIGANTAIFSLVEAVILRPLPYPDPHRLLSLWENDRIRGTTKEGFSLPDYLDVRNGNDVFDAMAAFYPVTTTWTSRDQEPTRVTVLRVSASLAQVLGISPSLGRSFRAEEDQAGAPPVVILSHGAFETRFGARPEILGMSLVLDGVLREIVGVMPEGFDFPPSLGATAALYLPLEAPTDAHRGSHGLSVVARVKEDIGQEEVNAKLKAFASGLEAAYPDDNLGRGMWAETLYQSTVGETRHGLLLLLAAVGFVLLVACVNVGSVLSSRALARAREIAIRSALGAGRLTLARQQLVESLLLSIGGGVLGFGISLAARRAFLALAPSDLPRAANVETNGAILVFTLVISVLAAVVFGTLPALSASRTNLRGSLSEGSSGAGVGVSTHRIRRVLLVGEISLAVALGFGAGLLMRSFVRLVRVDPGFDAANVVAVGLDLPASRYPQEFSNFPRWSQVRGFQTALLAELSERPGVDSAAIAINTPVDPGWTSRFTIEGRPEVAPGQQDEVRVRVVSPGYFRTVGLPVLRGRALTNDDERPGAPAAVVVNEAFAERYFGDGEPLGARVTQWELTREIVGVVKNEKFRGLGEDVPPALYPTFAQAPFAEFFLLVRSRERQERIVEVIRETVRSLDPELALGDVATLDERLSRTVAEPRFTTTVLSVFAALALGLAAVGIYGVMSQAVGERTRELGVRLSFGARPKDVLALVLGEGVRLAAAGTAIGFVLAAFLARAVESFLFGVEKLDLWVLASVAAVALGAGLLAAYLPARRASRIDPLRALRQE
jgi:putative ABC transport system permease protein